MNIIHAVIGFTLWCQGKKIQIWQDLLFSSKQWRGNYHSSLLSLLYKLNICLVRNSFKWLFQILKSCLLSDSHTNTVISDRFAYSSRWHWKPWLGPLNYRVLKCPYRQNFYFLIWFYISPNELLQKKNLIWIKCNIF